MPLVIFRLKDQKKVYITICDGKTGIILVKKGDNNDLDKEIDQMLEILVNVNIEHIKKIDLNAELVTGNVLYQLEDRVVLGGEMKRMIQIVLKQ
jgi:small subunit ribosomal protein S3